jgi:hypothetical protein
MTSESPPDPENEFDRSEIDITPVDKPVNKDLDHAALIEHGKRLAALEERLGRFETLLEDLIFRFTEYQRDKG